MPRRAAEANAEAIVAALTDIAFLLRQVRRLNRDVQELRERANAEARDQAKLATGGDDDPWAPS